MADERSRDQRDLSNRRIAMQIATQLPDDREEALAVIDDVERLLDFMFRAAAAPATGN